MKQAKEHAKRLKQLYQSLVRKHGKPEPAEATEPIHQLLEGILADCTSLHKAHAALQKVLAEMVDMNELRVTPPRELEQLLNGLVPLSQLKSQQIIDALNDIRKRQEDLDLGFLKDRGRREARDYLESLSGVGRPVAARVVLFSLAGHAIPVDDLTLLILRKDGIIDDTATAEEVQGFLERHISAAEARTFTLLMDKHVASKAARIDVDKLGELLNPPPPEPAPEKSRRQPKSAASGADGQKAGKPVPARAKKGAGRLAAKKPSPAPRSATSSAAQKVGATKKTRKKTGKP